jgi:hypothetical protein
MAAITTRETSGGSATVKGSPLTNTELDTNFINLNLGLTSAAAITGGTITGITDLAVADGGTGLSSLTAGYIPYGAGTSAFGSSANLFWDSTNSRLGIGTDVPGTKLTITANTALPASSVESIGLSLIAANSAGFGILLDTFANSSSLIFRRSSGTSASPTAIGANAIIGSIGARAYGTTGYSSAARAQIALNSSETWTNTAQGTHITFSTTANTTTTTAEKMRIDNAGNVGIGNTPSGTYKLEVTGDGYYSSNLTVAGNITFGGGASTLSATTIQIDDTLISLADNNTADILDIGFYAGYQPASTALHTGFVRDATDSVWKLFSGVSAQPTTTVDFTSATYDAMRIGALTATSGTFSGVITASAGTNTAPAITTSGDTNTGIFFPAADTIAFTEGGAEVMRIDSSSKLFVSGSSTALTAIPGSVGNTSVYSRIGMTVINDTTTLGYFQTYNSNAATDLKTWRHGGQTDGSYIFQTVNDAYSSSTTRLTLSSAGVLSDAKGDVRAAPIQTKSSAYIAAQTDAGQTIYISTGGVTINASVFNAGDMVTIINNSASNQTITAGASVTFRLAGTATTGNRTLAQRGMATFVCVVGGATPDFYCSGAGLT